MSFSDPIDQGAWLAEMHNEASLAKQREKSKPEQHKVLVKQEDGTEVLDWPIKECVDCDEPIEAGRLELARIRCFSCQQALEDKGKLYAKR